MRRLGDQDQWDLPLVDPREDAEAWVEVVIDSEKWDGYWFRATFRRGELVGVDVRRELGAAHLTLRLLRAIPLGVVERVARGRIDSWTREWAEGRDPGVRPGRLIGYEWPDGTTTTPDETVRRVMAIEDIPAGDVALARGKAHAMAVAGCLRRIADDGPDDPSEAEGWARQFGREPRNVERERTVLLPVAQAYVEHFGTPGWAAKIGKERSYSVETVSKLVKEARDAGILSPTTRGRGGGSLLPYAYELDQEGKW